MLFVLRDTGGVGLGVMYFHSIQRGGLVIHYTASAAAATRKTRAEWKALKATYPKQITGRLIRADSL